MSITIELPADVQERLVAEAARRGVTLDQLITELAQTMPLAESGAQRGRRPGFVAIGTSTTGRSARQADEMLDEGFGRD